MSTLELKVLFPPGNAVRMKAMKLKTTTTVKDTIAEIAKANKLANPEQFVLLLPPPQNDMKALWLEEGRLLSTYPLQAKDTIELRKVNQVIKIYFRRAYQRFLININRPLDSVVPLISKKFQLDNMKDYSLHLRKDGTVVDLTKSVREQRIYTDAIFNLMKKGEEVAEVEEEEEEDKEEGEEEGETSEGGSAPAKSEGQEDNQEPHDQRSAKSHKQPQKAGILKAKREVKKKFEDRYFVLKDGYLYEYKGPNDKKPLHFINLEKYNTRLTKQDEKDKKSKENQFTFELYSDNDLWIFKCEHDNHLNSWKKGIEKAIETASGTGSKGPALFGVPLSKIVDSEKGIPPIVEECVKYIDEKALDTVGIFRLSGSAVQIAEYRKILDKGGKVDLSQESDPHCVSGLMKLYLRSLPEPLCTFELYDQFIAAIMAPDKQLRIRYLRNLVNSLPKLNLALLKYLMAFLARVREHSANNKMEIHNLATIFAPNLLVSPDRSTLTLVQDTPQINAIVNLMIQEFTTIFGENELPERIAVALYDYTPQDNTEIALKKGEKVKVLSQNENGWWQGESDGKVGKFPGEYVKIETKSKRQKFEEEMRNIQGKVEEEKTAVKNLSQSKVQLEQEIEALEKEKKAFEEETRVLREELTKLMSQEKLDFLPKLAQFHGKLEAYRKVRTGLDDSRKGFLAELQALRNFLKNPPPDAKKNLKTKTSDRIEGLSTNLQTKLESDEKKRYLAGERFKDLSTDLEALHALFHQN